MDNGCVHGCSPRESGRVTDYATTLTECAHGHPGHRQQAGLTSIDVSAESLGRSKKCTLELSGVALVMWSYLVSVRRSVDSVWFSGGPLLLIPAGIAWAAIVLRPVRFHGMTTSLKHAEPDGHLS
jgi:hypothetical protein